MDLIKAICDCFAGSSIDDLNLTTTTTTTSSALEKQHLLSDEPTEEDLAAQILNILFTSEKSPEALTIQLQSIVSTTSWNSSLARHVLDGIVSALASGKVLVGTMREAYDKVEVVASDFVNQHPVLAEVIVTLIAIGILAVLVPWAVEALGFGELGVARGSFAAWWQSIFPDVEGGSLFSYLQRLGMKWGKAKT